MSGYSNVGNSQVYEAGDQRQVKASEMQEADRYNEGQPHSHKSLDSKDERTIANKLAAAEKKDEDREDPETKMSKRDPTLPAKMHGNDPSKGAKIDAELAAEEEAELKRKGRA